MARSASLELAEAPSARKPPLWAAAVAFSAVALAARGVDPWSWTIPVVGGAVGLALPLVVHRTAVPRQWIAITIAGAAAFAVARSFSTLPPSGSRWALGAAAVAAVGEEILFRRAMYGLLEQWGARVAIAGTSVVFALVHVPIYGWRVAGVDLAAGALFGWQRWATGSWTSPAVTHAAANVIQYL